MNHKEAHFLLRLLATFIDAAIGFAVNLYVINIVVKSTNIPELASNLFLFVLVLLSPFGLLYQILLTQWFGGTLGKLLTGIKITTTEGTSLSFKRIMFRQTIGYTFSSLLFGFGYLAILKNDKRQAWHDQAVGSLVVKSGNFWIIGLLVWIGMLGALGYFGTQTVKTALANEPLKQSFMQLYKDYQTSREPGGLEIYSEPKAKITLNDQDKGETPFKNTEIEPGEYKIKLVSEDKNTTPWEGNVTVEKGVVTLVSRDLTTSVLAGELITLESGKGLKITSDPSEADVMLDGKTVGKTPFIKEDASLGEHEVIVEKPGSGGRVIKVNIIENYQTHLHMELGKEQVVQNTNQTQPKPSATTKTQVFTYTDEDVAFWKEEMDWTSQQLSALQTWKNTNKDQAKVDRMIAMETEQNKIASTLYNKMIKKEQLTAADNALPGRYDALSYEYGTLLKEVIGN